MDTFNKNIIYILSLVFVILGAAPLLNAQSEGNDNYDYHTMGDKKFDCDSFTLTQSDIAQNQGSSISITKQMSAVIKEFPAGDKGLLLIFRNLSLRMDMDNNKHLFDFEVNEQGVSTIIVSAFLSDNTLEFRRYNSLIPGTSSFYSYKLYDKLFGLNLDPASGGAALNYEIYIYIKGSFIWVELNNIANPSLPGNKSKYAHSPVFWGINAAGGLFPDIMGRYLLKDPACRIRVYSPYVNEDAVAPAERVPYLRIASFNTDELLTDLNVRFTKGLGSAGAGKGIFTQISTGNSVPPAAIDTAKHQVMNNAGIVEKQVNFFTLSPNPVTSGFITITSTLQRAAILNVIISDSRGIQLQRVQYQATPGMMNKRLNVPATLSNGLYYLTIISGEATETLKWILNR